MHSKQFIDMIEEAARVLNISVTHLSTNWAMRLQKDGHVKYIVGNTFPLNNSAAFKMAQSKNLVSEILGLHQISNVPHAIFFTPQVRLRRGENSGNQSAHSAYYNKTGFPFVIKRNHSSKGEGVFYVSNEAELESIVSSINETDTTYCFSPYRNIIAEYRNIVLDGKCLLSYEKKRSFLSGDGKSTVAELLGNFTKNNPDKQQPTQSYIDEIIIKRLTEIPSKVEKVYLSWKHNAIASMEYPVVQDEQMSKLAILAAKAIDARFCSVDIIRTEEFGLEVLEINGSVVMNAFSQYSAENRNLAVRIYNNALEQLFV